MFKETYMNILGFEVTQEKHFPEANNWMWDYCIYLGSILYEDRKYDLGINKNHNFDSASWAIVDGNEPGSYHSNSFYFNKCVQYHLVNLLLSPKSIPWQITYILAKQEGHFDDMLNQVSFDHLSNYKEYGQVFGEIIGKGEVEVIIHKHKSAPVKTTLVNNGTKWYQVKDKLTNDEPDISEIAFIEYPIVGE